MQINNIFRFDIPSKVQATYFVVKNPAKILYTCTKLSFYDFDLCSYQLRLYDYTTLHSNHTCIEASRQIETWDEV